VDLLVTTDDRMMKRAAVTCEEAHEAFDGEVVRAVTSHRPAPDKTVVHFDRWWNPAVENQATDRAFRIGQTKRVLVHKFVCRGTVEEKIDQLIESKRQLSQDLLKGGAELLLTELKDEELLQLVALDIGAAMKET